MLHREYGRQVDFVPLLQTSGPVRGFRRDNALASVLGHLLSSRRGNRFSAKEARTVCWPQKGGWLL